MEVGPDGEYPWANESEFIDGALVCCCSSRMCWAGHWTLLSCKSETLDTRACGARPTYMSSFPTQGHVLSKLYCDPCARYLSETFEVKMDVFDWFLFASEMKF